VGKSSSSTYNLDVTGNGNIDSNLNVVNGIAANSLNLTGVSGNTLIFNNVTIGYKYFSYSFTWPNFIAGTGNFISYASVAFITPYTSVTPAGVICNVGPDTDTSGTFSAYVSSSNYVTGGMSLTMSGYNKVQGIALKIVCLVFY